MKTWQGILTNAVLIAVIIFLSIALNKSCNKPCDNSGTTVSDTTYITNDSLVYIKTPAPKPKIIKDTVISLKDFDSTAIKAIIKDYLATRIYSDTIRSNDIDIYLSEVLNRNRITHRDSVGYLYKKPTMVIKETKRDTINMAKRAIYIGFDLEGNQTNQDLFFGLTYVTKKGLMFNADYAPISKRVLVGAKMKIHLSR